MFATISGAYPGASADGAVEQTLRDQLEAGLGMITDGVIHGLDGSGRGGAATVVVDAWNRANDLLEEMVRVLEPGLEPPLLKACVVGPWTASAGAASAEEAGSTDHRPRSAVDATASVIHALFEAGCAVVDVCEDGLGQLAADSPEARHAADALADLASATHAAGHVSLSVSGGNVDHLGAGFFFDPQFASYGFDLIHGPDNWRLISQAPGDRGIICGVVDPRHSNPDDEAVLVWAARYAASSNGRGLQRVGLSTTVGFADLPRDVARRKLERLAEAARKAGLADAELAKEIDPMAVNARSAALGRFEPPPRRRRSGGVDASRSPEGSR